MTNITFDGFVKNLMTDFQYIENFKGKNILINCENPEYINFIINIFEELGIKKVTGIVSYNDEAAYRVTWAGERLIAKGAPIGLEKRIYENEAEAIDEYEDICVFYDYIINAIDCKIGFEDWIKMLDVYRKLNVIKLKH